MATPHESGETGHPAAPDFAQASVDEIFGYLSEDASAGRYRSILRQMSRLEGYDPYARDLEAIAVLVDRNDPKKAGELLARTMRSNVLLSPRAHFLAAEVFDRLDDSETAEMEEELGRLCLDLILATGEGTERSPRLVSRVDDAYDVLESLGKTLGGEVETIDRGSVVLDRFPCDDGEVLWFDVTIPYRKRGQQPRA